MAINKQINLPLLPPADSPTIMEIQIATRGLDLFDRKNWCLIVEKVARLYGIEIMRLRACQEVKEFANQCYEDALVSDSAFNPDRGY